MPVLLRSRSVVSVLTLAAVTACTTACLMWTSMVSTPAPSDTANVRSIVADVQPYKGGFGQMGGGGTNESERSRPEVVYIVPPITAKAARTWLKLNEPVAFNFPHETPLEDVLKYLKSATEEPKGKGLVFYVDPVGLANSEKQITSAVVLDVDQVSIASGLKLLLAQLDLVFHVNDEGLVVITSVDGGDHWADEPARILGELEDLKEEVASLRKVLDVNRPETRASNQAREIAEIREHLQQITRALAVSAAQKKAGQ